MSCGRMAGDMGWLGFPTGQIAGEIGWLAFMIGAFGDVSLRRDGSSTRRSLRCPMRANCATRSACASVSESERV